MKKRWSFCEQNFKEPSPFPSARLLQSTSMVNLRIFLAGTALVVAAACSPGDSPQSNGESAAPSDSQVEEPNEIVVQHILIAFAGANRSRATRSKAEAQDLAERLFEQAKGEVAFEDLVRIHSDDPIPPGDTTPGTYKMWNFDYVNEQAASKLAAIDAEFASARQSLTELRNEGRLDGDAYTAQIRDLTMSIQARKEPYQAFPRSQMAPAFGNVGFRLKVGEIGLAPYDSRDSQFGWHIIKRLE